MILDFVVPGKAVGKERWRTGTGHPYTPPKTRRYQELVARCAYVAMIDKGVEMSEGEPLAVEILAYFARPKAKKHQHERFPLHITRADDDNIEKCIKDALKGVAYKDDKQIVDTHVCLRYCQPHHPHQGDMLPHVKVRVWTAGMRNVD